MNSPLSGDFHSAFERRDNDGIVSGEYELVQPDGLRRVVTYTADKTNGFQSSVQYIPVNT